MRALLWIVFFVFGALAVVFLPAIPFGEDTGQRLVGVVIGGIGLGGAIAAWRGLRPPALSPLDPASLSNNQLSAAPAMTDAESPPPQYDLDGVTVVRGHAGVALRSEAVLTLDPQGLEFTHPRRTRLAWSEIEQAEVVSLSSGKPGSRRIPTASVRLPSSATGFRARLRELMSSDVKFIGGVYDLSAQEIVDLIERYRLRYGAAGTTSV